MSDFPATIEVVDSHTEGEPTRVVLSGWPAPNGRTMAERRDTMRREQEHLRRAVVLEPRGHDAVVGALLTTPVAAGSLAGVVFFNNVGYLGMCGHGLIGVVRTLAHLGRVQPGTVRIDTPVGTVAAELEGDGAVTLTNVAAYCHARDVAVEVPGLGRVVGDVAWGGNWFFLTRLDEPIHMGNLQRLSAQTMAIKDALAARGITGRDGGEIDHVEVFGPALGADADSRNFVMCPGGEYDRSPCGTGTSAKLAALYARGELALGQRWRQESVCGGRFEGWLTEENGALVPHIRGRAWVTGRATLLFDASDPFRGGIGA
ncbi:MAG: proline racemase family protein [Acidobacteriota bacterium]